MNNKKIKQTLLGYFGIYIIGIPFMISLCPNGLDVIMNFVLSVIFLLWMIQMCKQVLEESLKKILDVCEKSFKIGLIAIFLLIVSIVCSYGKITLNIDNNVGYSELVYQFLNNKLIFGILIIFISPFIEELLYKYVLFEQTEILKEHWVIKAISVSMLFAAMHVLPELINFQFYVILDILNYFIFGMVTTVYYKKTSNIYAPLAVHILCNAVALILL